MLPTGLSCRRRQNEQNVYLHLSVAAVFLVAYTGWSTLAHAQDAGAGTIWDTDLSNTIEITPTDDSDAGAGSDTGADTTVVPRSLPQAGDTVTAPKPVAPPVTNGKGAVRLVALLTDAGQKIDRGIIWRIFQERTTPKPHNQLVHTLKKAAPVLNLATGDYIVNAAFGRAHLTRKITVQPGGPSVERFVINAGGLRVQALVGTEKAPPETVSYTILEGEADQSGNRGVVMSGARPDLIIRLNSGIYHVISTYGDANATVSADVTVEAGKLSEATISHAAATVTFKLVTRAGGEALPGTRWTIRRPGGEVVKRSVGALPTHILAPGSYVVAAELSGNIATREIEVSDGDRLSVEISQ